ncbi:unnamed protein product [Ceutorhynchus assimilis]|uniref:Uncharacterized protein n=1 Tax=Ceutorhynchus assimilis TaxID=467358 RepID=A0A9N9MSF7_9CUCU|nr:unnamed protein product [Ceutorhynchus assimilis]
MQFSGKFGVRMLSYLAIILSLITMAVPTPDVTTISVTHPSGKISTTLKSRPKPVKRSPIHRTPSFDPRILSKKTPPLNVLQNGPYFINHHYIYCENLDHHTLEEIKSSGNPLEVLNFYNKNKFSDLTPSLDSIEHSGYDGNNKELHILHLPKDKQNDFNDINLHLALENAHETSKLPSIDFDLNKNFDSFEVNLASIKPPKLDISLLPTVTTSTFHKIVTPLVQGHITAGKPPNYNFNSNHFNEFFNTNHNDLHSQQNGIKGNNIVDPPHFERQPLERDNGKSSYDTPGAVDSYGHPVTSTSQTVHVHGHFQSNFPANGHRNVLKKDEFFIPEEYYNQLNEIHEIQRKRRQEMKSSKNLDNRDGSKHPNHKYD